MIYAFRAAFPDYSRQSKRRFDNECRRRYRPVANFRNPNEFAKSRRKCLAGLPASAYLVESFLTSNPQSESNATQPILCCVGLRVAGKPTQFLMERAIAANELDWRAITVEIRHEDFATALAGMHAMRFVAVRFFPSLHQTAAACVNQAAKLTSFVGSVTSASWTPDGWNGWHNWGLAIHRWAASRIEISQSLCWLHGNSVTSRSMLSALHDLAIQPDALPKSVIWTDPPPNLPQELLRLGDGDQTLNVRCVASDEHSQSEHSVETAAAQLKALAMDAAVEAVLIIGDTLPAEIEKKVGDELPVFVAGARPAIASAVAYRREQLTVLNELDQIVACESYDFERWTGHQIDFNVLRDAYDEYYDI